ncbi:MAG: sensor histidine kinase, partial [Gemmatimonadota bacterium]
MRRRLVGTMLAIAMVCVVMLGVPLAVLARREVWTSARDRLREQTAGVAIGLENRLEAHQPINLHRYLALMPGRRIVVGPAGGPWLVAGPRLSGSVLHATVAAADDTITVQASEHEAFARAREVTLVVAALAALAMLAAVGLAVWQARRLGQPIAGLVARADALGQGKFAAAPLNSGVPEIDRISQVLERSARKIGALVQLQREFAADAAHQLRTPLTSIGLHLDEISSIGDEPVQAEAEQALARVDRLNAVITALLARARGDTIEPTIVDLTEVVTDASDAWERILAHQGRRLVVDVAGGATVFARRDHLHGVLTSLLDNAVSHGEGTVTVSVDRDGASVQLRVRDEGPGVPAEIEAHIFERRVSGNRGTGIGLALAHALTAAE